VLQPPATVTAARQLDDVDGLGEAWIARRFDSLEVIEGAEDVVVPPGRKIKAGKRRLDDFAGSVGAKETVCQQKLAAAGLRGPHFPDIPSAIYFVVPQTLEHADCCIH